jgi:S-adenosylmethionine/arginine decarboxylase-like enzyme
VPPSLTHDAADFRGVPASLLRDQAALSGLLIAASGAAGLTTVEPPVMRLLPRGGLVIILLLDIGHVAVHTVPDEGVLALDLLVSAQGYRGGHAAAESASGPRDAQRPRLTAAPAPAVNPP